MKRTRIFLLRSAPALAVAALMAGCSVVTGLSGSTSPAAPRCRAPRGVELIIGAHRNAPAPALDSRLECQVANAVSAGQPVQIVVAVGQPQLLRVPLLNPQGGTIAERARRASQDLQRIRAAVRTARPDSPGVDDLAALSEAGDEARTDGYPHAELVLIDSGLDDRGALDFTVPGMLAADPAEVVRQLTASGNLPDLRGFSVVLVGIGYTAPPQTPLSAKWRSGVTQIWAAVLRSAGAKVEVIPQPGQGSSVTTWEPVKKIRVPRTPHLQLRRGTTIALTGTSPVRFEPNSTAFVDPAGARRTLRPIARWLDAVRSRHSVLEGTTADVGPLSGQRALALARADRVRAVLIALGATRGQITTKGVGSDFPKFVPDRNAAGTLLAGLATVNRSVRITLG
jgi:OOP family OmpA-OmpF porin